MKRLVAEKETEAAGERNCEVVLAKETTICPLQTVSSNGQNLLASEQSLVAQEAYSQVPAD